MLYIAVDPSVSDILTTEKVDIYRNIFRLGDWQWTRKGRRKGWSAFYGRRMKFNERKFRAVFSGDHDDVKEFSNYLFYTHEE